MSATFNLTELVHKVMDETDLADPADIAAKVVEKLPAQDRLAALQQAMPTFVRVAVTRNRGPKAATARRVGRKQAGRSAKVAAIRAAAPVWKRALRERLHVGRGLWLLLAECTYEHLMFAVGERRQMALRNTDAADRYEKVAAALTEYGVETVQELPESVLAELFPAGDEEAA